jgi:NADH-quinone oxidoreductase subunit H
MAELKQNLWPVTTNTGLWALHFSLLGKVYDYDGDRDKAIVFGCAAPANLFFLNWLPGSFWLWLKATSVVFIYIWVRATLPRDKYSDLMD